MPIPDSPITLTAYAARRGVSKMTITRAVQRGRLVQSVVRDSRGVPSISDPELADREWAANTDYTDAPQRVAPAPSPPSQLLVDILADPKPVAEDLATAAARQKHWAASLAELKFREAAGELIPARELRTVAADTFAACKTQLLALPSRARQELPHLSASDLETLEAILREALHDLAISGRKLTGLEP